MPRLVIEYGVDAPAGSGFDVVDDAGQRANGLSFDEMLGQVISIVHPKLSGSPQYAMRTEADWDAEAIRRAARVEARKKEREAEDWRNSHHPLHPSYIPF